MAGEKKSNPPPIVVSCPSAFPLSKRKRSRPERPSDEQDSATKKKKLLDWHDTAKEVRKLGATAFEGVQKRNYQDEEYKRLTGRQRKKHHVPLPIVRGIRKKAAERRARTELEAKQAGIVMPKKAKKRTNQEYNPQGPAPSIGKVKNGVLKVKK